MINENLPSYVNKRIAVDEDTGCWNWIAMRSPSGYGLCMYKKKKFRTHRLVYTLVIGKIPDGLDIHHKCENRLCCNPEHLLPLTRSENSKLVTRKGVLRRKLNFNSASEYVFFGKIFENSNLPKRKLKYLSKLISKNNGTFCWEWLGTLDPSGYGRISVGDGRVARAHRFIYELITNTKIPDNMVSDHKCRNRKCVNPLHINIVTAVENIKRARLIKTKLKENCIYGHKFTKENTKLDKSGKRICRQCDKETYAKRRGIRVEDIGNIHRKEREKSLFCKMGHPRTPENLYSSGDCKNVQEPLKR